MHTGGTPDNPLCIRCTSGVPPVYTARRVGESGGSVRDEPEACGDFAEHAFGQRELPALMLQGGGGMG